MKNDDGTEEVFYHQIGSSGDLESIRKLKPPAPEKEKLKRNPEKVRHLFLIYKEDLCSAFRSSNNDVNSLNLFLSFSLQGDYDFLVAQLHLFAKLCKVITV